MKAMSKFCVSLVGLLMIGSAIGIATHPAKATPAKAPAKATPIKTESKSTQCKRFEKVLTSYNQEINTALADKMLEAKDLNTLLTQIRQGNSKSRQKLQSTKFSDPKILKIRQSIVDAGSHWDKSGAELIKTLAREEGEEARTIMLNMVIKQTQVITPAYDYCQWQWLPPVGVGKTVKVRMGK
jgi:hypothetical protein